MDTANIPKTLPIKCSADDYEAIIGWMSKQPHHSLDGCVNRTVRWSYYICDEGIFSTIKVTDNGTKEVFAVPLGDPENW
jgi:hypothetical protein